MIEIERLQKKLREFADERDWEQFHSPKNLAMALSVEVAELQEHFQWLTEAQSLALDDETREAVALEMADVLIYLVRMADRCNVDLADAVDRKLVINAHKYPVRDERL